MIDTRPEPPDLADRALDAAITFALKEWPRFARKVAYRMQRISASGIFGDEYRHRTLWDEYCHEVQNGPHELLEAAWEATVDSIVAAVVDDLPPHIAAVLTIDAELDYEPAGEVGTIWRDGLLRALRASVDGLAAARSLCRFEVW